MSTRWIATDEAVTWFDNLPIRTKLRILLFGIVISPVMAFMIAVDAWIQAEFDDH